MRATGFENKWKAKFTRQLVRQLCIKLPCVTRTPFGAPVEPEEYCKNATESGLPTPATLAHWELRGNRKWHLSVLCTLCGRSAAEVLFRSAPSELESHAEPAATLIPRLNKPSAALRTHVSATVVSNIAAPESLATARTFRSPMVKRACDSDGDGG